MKNSLKISIATLASAALLSGCIKETFPEGSSTTGDYVTAKSLVNAIPSSMTSANTSGYLTQYDWQGDFGIPALHIIYENMLEDVVILGSEPGYNQFYRYAINQAMGETTYFTAYYWDSYYHWIKLCNLVFQTIDPATANTDELGYIGQAYAYRAMCYLDLARLYEPKENKYSDVTGILGLTVPIVTEKTTELEGRNNPRATHDQIYEFILSDLAQAENFLEGKSYDFTHPGKAAVYGLYARTYLEMGAAGKAGAYAKAAEYARKAISESGCTPLTQAQWEDPITGFNSGSSNNSWMWGLTLVPEQTNNLVNFTAQMCNEATWGYGPLTHQGANKALYEGISNKDFRKHSWIDPAKTDFYKYKINGDAASFLENAAEYESIKFRPAQGETRNNTVGNMADHPLMRVEEMYFIEIEATAQTNLSAAQDLLNSYMTMRILDGSYNCKINTTDLKSFLKEMLFQKRVEFWGEGILLFDYKRLDAGITRKYAGSNHPAVFSFNSDGRSPQWNIVITRGETLNNGAIKGHNNPDPSGLLN